MGVGLRLRPGRNRRNRPHASRRRWGGGGLPVGYLSLPEPNRYIPTDFDLRYEAKARSVPAALLVDDGDAGVLFHRPDKRFGSPKAVLQLEVCCAHAGESAEARLLSEMGVKVVVETLNEESYAATIAGLGYELWATLRGWCMQVAGFSHKAPELLLKLCEALAVLAETPCDLSLWSRVSEEKARKLANANFRSPDLACYARLSCLEANFFTVEERRALLPSMTPAKLSAHVGRSLRDGVFTSCYVGGNLNGAEARHLYGQARLALTPPPPTGGVARLSRTLVARRSPRKSPRKSTALPPVLAPLPTRLAAKERCVLLPSAPQRHVLEVRPLPAPPPAPPSPPQNLRVFRMCRTTTPFVFHVAHAIGFCIASR